MVIAWLPLHRRVSLWVLGKAEAGKDDDASTNNSPVWITVASACVRLLLLCITNRVLDCCKFPMPCIPVEHVRHPSIYLHAHSIIFNPSTWHNHQQQQQQHCCHPPRPCPESSAMEKRMEISQIRTYPQPPTQFPVSNRRRRPSLVNSFPFPCHSVLPSSSRRSQRISRPSISIAVVPPINKISLWPWEPTPLSISSCSAIFYPFDIEIWIESTSSSSSAASSPPFTACLSSSFPRARIRKIEF